MGRRVDNFHPLHVGLGDGRRKVGVEKAKFVGTEIVHRPSHFFGIPIGRVHQAGHKLHPRGGFMVGLHRELLPAAQGFGGHK